MLFLAIHPFQGRFAVLKLMVGHDSPFPAPEGGWLGEVEVLQTASRPIRIAPLDNILQRDEHLELGCRDSAKM